MSRTFVGLEQGLEIDTTLFLVHLNRCIERDDFIMGRDQINPGELRVRIKFQHCQFRRRGPAVKKLQLIW